MNMLKKNCLIALTAGLAVATQAAITVFPDYPGEPVSTTFSVTANNVPVAVHSFNFGPPITYSRFAFTGSVVVKVTLNSGALSTYKISPQAYGITATKNGNVLTFTLTQPRKILLKAGSNELAIFAETPEINPPTIGDANVINIRDYQVDTTGTTKITAKINTAISDVNAKQGGGYLYFPPGKYLTGTMLLKDNVKIYVAAGALIVGCIDSTDYPALPGNITWGNALIYGNHCSNAGIMGQGCINAKGRERYDAGNRRDIHAYKFVGCKNSIVKDLMLLNSWSWTVHIVDCDTVLVNNIKLINFPPWPLWTDGIDVDVSRDILVDDCFLYCGDDPLAIYGNPGVPRKPIRDVLVRNCVFSTWACGMRVGYKYSEEDGWEYVNRLTLDNVHLLSYGDGSNNYQDGFQFASHNLANPVDTISIINCTAENFRDQTQFPDLFQIDDSCRPKAIFITNFTSYNTDNHSNFSRGNVIFKCLKLNGTSILSTTNAQAANFTISPNAAVSFLTCDQTSIVTPQFLVNPNKSLDDKFELYNYRGQYMGTTLNRTIDKSMDLRGMHIAKGIYFVVPSSTRIGQAVEKLSNIP